MKTPQQIRNEVEKEIEELKKMDWVNDNAIFSLLQSRTAQASILTEYDKSIKEMIESFRQELKHCDEFFNVNDYENTQSTDKFMGIVELFLKQELLSKIGDNSEVKE